MKNIFLALFLTSAFVLNSQVNFQWAKGLGGTFEDFSQTIAIDGSGNVYTIGSFSGTADFDPGVGVYNLSSNGKTDVFVSKLNASGSFVWAKQIGGIGEEDGNFFIDATGNVYVTGAFEDVVDFDPGVNTYNLTSNEDRDIFLSKLDASGNFVWAKMMGGVDDQGGISVTSDAGGNIYLTGTFMDAVDFDPGPAVYNLISTGILDVFVTKLDASGSFVWTQQFSGNNIDLAYGISIAVDGSGNVYTNGTFDGVTDFDPGVGVSNLSTAGSDDMFVSKLNSSGAFVFAKAIGGTGTDGGWTSMIIDASNNVYLSGSFEQVVDFDPGVGVYNLTSMGNTDVFVCKLDGLGDFVWAKSIGGSTWDESYSLASDATGNLYTTGYFAGTVDFDPGVGVSNLTSKGGDDSFILKLDATGNYVWAAQMGGTDEDSGNSIAVDASNNVYTTGIYKNTCDFDPGVAVNNLTSAGGKDVFVHKMSQGGSSVGVNEFFNNAASVSIYPNPTSGILNVTLEMLNDELAQIQILNEIGQVIMEETSTKNLILNTNNFPQGMYFVKVINGGRIITTKKIVKQ